jgi:hypothetical protein
MISTPGWSNSGQITRRYRLFDDAEPKLMSRSYEKSKGRKESGSFLAIPHTVLNSPNFHHMTHKAKAMLLDLGAQYKGKNNGDLSATWNQLKPKGWRSKATITAALNELEYYGFIVKSRQGGRRQCSLYALTWRSIDECNRKTEIPATNVASNDWKEHKPPMQPNLHPRREIA